MVGGLGGRLVEGELEWHVDGVLGGVGVWRERGKGGEGRGWLKEHKV